MYNCKFHFISNANRSVGNIKGKRYFRSSKSFAPPIITVSIVAPSSARTNCSRYFRGHFWEDFFHETLNALEINVPYASLLFRKSGMESFARSISVNINLFSEKHFSRRDLEARAKGENLYKLNVTREAKLDHGYTWGTEAITSRIFSPRGQNGN